VPAPRSALVTRAGREHLADWLIVLGAAGLLVALFLPWSHQFSPAFLARFGASEVLSGVPHDPTAWQVYSIVDVALALLAGGLVAVAFLGGRSARAIGLVLCALALAFTVHALAHPPTNHADIFDPASAAPGYLSSSPSSGAGETVAVGALAVALAGLALSFTAA
jgi:hypothetical protein